MSVTYTDPARRLITIPIYGGQSFACPVGYGAQFKQRFSGAIVPDAVRVQHLTTRDARRITLLHCDLPVHPDLSHVHRIVWQARAGTPGANMDGNKNPSTVKNVMDNVPLETFVALTCLAHIQNTPEARLEQKICDVIFPGAWALLPYRKHIVLWYKQKILLPFEHGMVFCDDPTVRHITERYATTQ